MSRMNAVQREYYAQQLRARGLFPSSCDGPNGSVLHLCSESGDPLMTLPTEADAELIIRGLDAQRAKEERSRGS